MAKMNLNLVGFLLLFVENLYNVSSGTNERSFNGAVRVREGCFFTDNPLLSKRTASVFACTHVCLSNTLCISIAFCEHGSKTTGQCHLFNKGIRLEQTVENSPSLVKKNGCTFYQFVDVFEGCNSMKCQNGASCYHDNDYGGFKCACTGNYEGDHCKSIVYRFTNLQSSGRTGPTSQSEYTGTTLEGRVTLLQGKQKWSVPLTGQYHFDIQGASGGDGKWGKGGKGARVSGFVSLTKTTSLIIVVGQQGVSNNADGAGGGGGGGGGGSFVFHFSTKRLIGAAGGGGGGGGLITQKNGEGGLANETGGIYGGKKGHGGASCTTQGYPVSGGGGGYKSNGLCFKGPTCNITTQCDAGGGSYTNGFLGGKGDGLIHGGFGGGGAGNDSSPGGGGGYSGGGVSAFPIEGFAGGGGSFKDDSSWNAVSNFKTGHGSVTVTFHG